jgi:DNA-binding transcriptional ArsR family regulator
MDKKMPTTYRVRGQAQQRAIASPLRLEIIGQFVSSESLSVREIAARMGRPASAIHYHVGVLEKAGLFRSVGERRDGRRREAEYRPVADVLEVVGSPKRKSRTAADTAVRTLSAAFRMAERDLKAALSRDDARQNGADRNVFCARLHCRIRKSDLAAVNRHLDAIQGALAKAHHRNAPRDDDEFVSLTIALLPLPDRAAKT